jgi:hypothetical protein
MQPVFVGRAAVMSLRSSLGSTDTPVEQVLVQQRWAKTEKEPGSEIARLTRACGRR